MIFDKYTPACDSIIKYSYKIHIWSRPESNLSSSALFTHCQSVLLFHGAKSRSQWIFLKFEACAATRVWIYRFLYSIHFPIATMASYKVEVVESSPISVLGEGPHWDVERQSLYYNDIYGDKQSISRYDFREDKTYNAVIPGHEVVSFIIPVDNTKDQFVIGSGKKIVLIEWDGRKGQAKPLKTVGEVEPNLPENRFNDAKCDPFGRFFGGTMRIGKFLSLDSIRWKKVHNFLSTELNCDIFEKRLGTFYRYTNKEQFVPLKSAIGVSNGLAWNEQTNKFYYIDSCDLDVKEFDYDPESGNICEYKLHRVSDLDEFEGPACTLDGLSDVFHYCQRTNSSTSVVWLQKSAVRMGDCVPTMQWINETVHSRWHDSGRIYFFLAVSKRTYQFALILIVLFACLQPMDVLLLILPSMESVLISCPTAWPSMPTAPCTSLRLEHRGFSKLILQRVRSSWRLYF